MVADKEGMTKKIPSGNSVEVNGIFKSFDGVEVLKGISFSIKSGETFGLLGINGAGKTTLIRILASTIQPDAGEIKVAGFSPRTQPTEVRKQLGVLTTDIGIYDRLTAYENVKYFADLAGIKSNVSNTLIDQLFAYFGIDTFRNRLTSKLSTGMRQKITIVRAVIHQPSILIFDEPTLGLDIIASQAVLEFIRHQKNASQTIVLSTHNMHLAETVCDRIGLIHKGTVVAIDTPKNVIKSTRTKNLDEAFLQIIKGGRND